ncbi:hypothetical protein P153DRAFT_119276 [Dothidotthia symphoricarpi CBS 119687]|uniref:Uncharacterized protein n=1 Tax=Dothidotthia symphoricarpi CBS 119687 TaxID=1392245 RepID=A0A6A6A2E7_9PLEO|nr:uncharacterized protein P153DRAFT_119276 [Dothidotthia symphoricarpi CBS 119687]KAF2125077.1 hypothetical protein P153DRAFT_119276 [Dothidotthia symphoricarpi CBS 119687]
MPFPGYLPELLLISLSCSLTYVCSHASPETSLTGRYQITRNNQTQPQGPQSHHELDARRARCLQGRRDEIPPRWLTEFAETLICGTSRNPNPFWDSCLSTPCFVIQPVSSSIQMLVDIIDGRCHFATKAQLILRSAETSAGYLLSYQMLRALRIDMSKDSTMVVSRRVRLLASTASRMQHRADHNAVCLSMMILARKLGD